MKAKNYFLILIALFIGANVNAQWAVNYTNSTGTKTYCDVKFLDNNVGFVLAQERQVLKTTDNGQTWSELTPIPGSAIMASFDFTSENVGVAVGATGSIYRTTDGGATWTGPLSIALGVTTPATPNPITRALNSVRFYDANTGYIFGNYGTILQTTDGGATWSRILNEQATAVHYYTASVIDATTARIGVLYDAPYALNSLTITKADKTVNGLTTNAGYYGSYFFDANTGYMAGYRRSTYLDILKTTDGGVTWTKNVINDTNTGTLRGIKFLNTQSGIAVGDAGNVWETSDAGTTWIKNSNAVFTSVPLKGIATTQNGNIYIVGTNKILKYINTSTLLSPTSIENLVKVSIDNKQMSISSNLVIQTVEITDLTGKTIIQIPVNGTTVCKEFNSLSGLFLLKTITEKGSFVKKIVL
jgi:photosystem II stability/assembly factor-like uncharacterized protein